MFKLNNFIVFGGEIYINSELDACNLLKIGVGKKSRLKLLNQVSENTSYRLY